MTTDETPRPCGHGDNTITAVLLAAAALALAVAALTVAVTTRAALDHTRPYCDTIRVCYQPAPNGRDYVLTPTSRDEEGAVR